MNLEWLGCLLSPASVDHKFEDGIYEVSLTIVDDKGCLNTVYETVVVGKTLNESSLSPLSVDLEANLNIYPVPVTGNSVTIDIGAYNADRMMQVSLFDLSGKMVYQDSDIAYYTPKHTIDVSQLKPGTYFARIEAGNDVVSKRIAIE